MKKLLSALLLGGLLSAGGCSDKNYYYDIEGVEYLDFVYENVVRSEWSAYESLDRYELFISEPFITTRHYENGLSNAYVWIVEEGDEVRKQLPYSYTAYYHGVPYLLTIDYDIVVGEVGFFVHCFPEMAPRSLLPGSVDLKLSLIWENRQFGIIPAVTVDNGGTGNMGASRPTARSGGSGGYGRSGASRHSE